MTMAVAMIIPMIMMARAVVGMLGVMRCLRNPMGMLVVGYPHLLTRPCFRNFMGMLVSVDCFWLL